MPQAGSATTIEFPDSLEWFNVRQPPTMASLKDRLVFLVFWHYGNILCQHLKDELTLLSDEHSGQFDVIWIHSPKFKTEANPDNLSQAIERLDIRQAVASDVGFLLWEKYSIKAWPSIAVIHPDGNVVGVFRGEGRYQQLKDLIVKTPTVFTADAPIAQLPAKESGYLPDSQLKFPGKVYATPNQVFITDSGNNRIIETWHNGEIKRVFGSGEKALADGVETEAAFNNPQGMTHIGGFLFVADTGNHAIRRIQLSTGEVLTIAGNGQQGRYAGDSFANARESQLNSPWDLCSFENNLFITMAGQHQIWKMNVKHQGIERYAGSGREDIIDGENKEACFAKPTGITSSGKDIYVADAQTSAIRGLFAEANCVDTLVGDGLFVYGDRDGIASRVRLQHPLGLVADPGRNAIWIADTYNSRIKRLDITSREVTRYDFDCPLNEPSGLCLYNDTLMIANTNAHEILCLDLKTREVTQFEIRETMDVV
ncbi:MAG: thiol-disulfide isomerase [Gammaproteobacteria bacterium]